jgi:regulator of cell morphogenesis and NO signaling
MIFRSTKIESAQPVSDIVERDYRTAAVFRKYGIEYCCAGKKTLEMACFMAGANMDQVRADLDLASRIQPELANLPFESWDVDFLTEYVVNIHHHFIRQALPEAVTVVGQFAEHHKDKFPHMMKVTSLLEKLHEQIIPHLRYEEDVLFPYMCQVEHAFENKGDYGRLLVKTLRKPLEQMREQHHRLINETIPQLRELTSDYTPVTGACLSHKLSMQLINAIDSDLSQHTYLENEILIPRILGREKSLLEN